ncbi:TetR/AcrR family transcriptional regulator [Gluconacetobacter sp. 1b LMG 1731]|uniref:TetR/AcrR family transcriptional regulator n=2 Tax=Gluconacetobacter dulcium TaxID=2729096 RepID=A0A7W4IPE9_9PROT|nr:TetR/AcrR family transcriptional regulator [Gluconacetobacter dulcium]MBB2195743.1 TetR/AcrR family transcriptional regulator [Gluconacetobacter dulcium]
MGASNVYAVNMDRNDNSVNIKKAAYHHGDLRAALIAEGLRLLAERDVDSLSLRAVARGVGVSATSVYRHFPDKEALLTALALEGLAQLGVAQHAAARAAGGGCTGFAATGRAYVRFALANPALFRLIFASPVLAPAKAAGTLDTEAARLLRANAALVAAQQGGEAATRAIEAWALVHGLAMLMLDGQIPQDETIIDEVIG